MTVASLEDNYNFSFKLNLALGLLFSLSLHALLAISIINQHARPVPPAVTIDVFLSEFANEQQIVSPPDIQTESEVAPTDTRFLSDKNFITPKEQIKRGDSPQAGPVVAQNNSSAQTSEANKAINPSPAKSKLGVTNLKLSSGTLQEKFGNIPKAEEKPTLDQEIGGLASSEPFNRGNSAGAVFAGVRGSNDFAPRLPDGDITLLNTKANMFAVFVRRVAEQVFGRIRFEGFDNIRASDIRSVTGYTIVTAIMSPQGKFLSAQIEESSGSARFDSAILSAAQRATNDQNPPKEAAATDGNIHFIFKAKSWVRVVPTAREGVLEQRWLLLGTGLE